VTDWTLVRARGLAKWWDADSGLRPLDLDVDRGELLVVRGRSGSGKSTLVGILAGWCEPDAGTLDWCGLAPGESPLHWRTVAFAPQVLAPVTELSVLENVALPLRAGGVPRSEALERAADALAAVDLTGQARRAADAVSLGQQQRMSVARAAVIRPELLIADEPTSHQDAGHVDAVVALLRATVRSGSACVVVTHDPAVAAVADRVVDLDVLA
jgi:putative ABC transport system ATP-binding protein